MGSSGPGCNRNNPITKLPQNFPQKTSLGKTTTAAPTLATKSLRPFVFFTKPSRKPDPGAPSAVPVADTRFPTEAPISINHLTAQPVLSKPTPKPGQPDPAPQTFQAEPFEPLKIATPIYFQETNTESIFNAETTPEVLHTAG